MTKVTVIKWDYFHSLYRRKKQCWSNPYWISGRGFCARSDLVKL